MMTILNFGQTIIFRHRYLHRTERADRFHFLIKENLFK